MWGWWRWRGWSHGFAKCFATTGEGAGEGMVKCCMEMGRGGRGVGGSGGGGRIGIEQGVFSNTGGRVRGRTVILAGVVVVLGGSGGGSL